MVTDINNYTKQGIIPLTQIPSQQFDIVLGGQNCNIAVYQKDEYVFLDLSVDNEIIFTGIKALDRQGIKFADYMNFDGQIWFEDLNGTENPQYTGFGDRWILYYGTK